METRLAIRTIARHEGYGKHLLFFPSRKTHQQVVCHSVLEADYCVHLEYNPKVVHYCSHPGEIHLEVGGRMLRYQPDFQIDTSELRYYTEVKANFDEIPSRWTAKLRAAQEFLKARGSDLRLADIASIRPTERLRNLKFLYFHSFNVGTDEFGSCLRWLPTLKYPATMRQLLTNSAGIRERAIYKATFDDLLAVDLDQRLSLDTPVLGGSHEHYKP